MSQMMHLMHLGDAEEQCMRGGGGLISTDHFHRSVRHAGDDCRSLRTPIDEHHRLCFLFKEEKRIGIRSAPDQDASQISMSGTENAASLLPASDLHEKTEQLSFIEKFYAAMGTGKFQMPLSKESE